MLRSPGRASAWECASRRDRSAAHCGLAVGERPALSSGLPTLETSRWRSPKHCTLDRCLLPLKTTRRAMAEYSRAGEARARALGNRGPIRLGADGKLAQDILDAYWTNGFYVFEGVAGPEELAELRADVDAILDTRAGRARRGARPPRPAGLRRGRDQAALSLGQAVERPARRHGQEQRPPSGGDEPADPGRRRAGLDRRAARRQPLPDERGAARSTAIPACWPWPRRSSATISCPTTR